MVISLYSPLALCSVFITNPLNTVKIVVIDKELGLTAPELHLIKYLIL
jgi:hypothetical protein